MILNVEIGIFQAWLYVVGKIIAEKYINLTFLHYDMLQTFRRNPVLGAHVSTAVYPCIYIVRC